MRTATLPPAAASPVALYVGTSGWAYPEWRGTFYPAGLPQGEFLAFYGRELGAWGLSEFLQTKYVRVDQTPEKDQKFWFQILGL